MNAQGQPPQAVLFDLDGVLLDSAQTIRTALAAVATCATNRRHALASLPDAALTQPREEVLHVLGVSNPADACRRWWDGALASSPPATFPGVLAGLQALHSAGIAVGVVTLQDRHRLDWLLPPDLSTVLDVVVTRQDAAAKPSPDGVHAALNRLGVNHQHALMVGDSPSDILAACRAGVLALAAAWGFHPPAALLSAGAQQVLPAPSCIGRPLLEHLERRG
ncbi:HAD family hydrolase [Actinacidiphila rubida]|uniref:Phosphoglycolate phosphatase n=1 Tax=Actinacidiphila rubida TaxID=310780 RepID=A0A1H8S7S1_9ACTN|nr:HAD-IA family hydrolase [Actinacidiphila rubida]SEO74203.1 phosphoglycolate phosphatase [Actinacidiphila rubida]